ncbi:MAG: hypothetical protein WCM76_06310 [Bacteroidota bacterium]
MRYLKKWYVVVLIVFVTTLALESCSRHYRYKKMIKRRRSAVAKRYHSPWQKKIKRNTIPINQNFIIKNKRNTRGVPTAARRTK